MTISEWPGDPSAQVLDLTARLGAAENDKELLTESLVDLQFAAEDAGWRKLGADAARQFTRQGLGQLATNCRVMAVAAPLIKRGLALRTSYVWGQGVTVAARAGADAGQDVNAVVTGFWSDESNQASLTSSQAQEELERTGLGCDGNVFLALFTNPRTGRVTVRSTPFDEVTDIITNPEDRDDPWFYTREWETTIIEAGAGATTTRTRWQRNRALHPALGYWPAMRPKSIDGIPVMWNAPILHVSVNRLDGWKFGIGDAYAALEWCRYYDGFLVDWARLVKSLSRFAWRATSGSRSAAKDAARKIADAQLVTPPQNGVGSAVSLGPGQGLEAIPKSGATIDSESGRPLAAMVAASLGVPVTMLLADPGVTGARATAETLDKPTVLEMGMRRALWGDAIRRVLSYVIDQAVKAPAGPLSGTVLRDPEGRETITLTGDVERSVIVDWPALDDLDPQSLVTAVVAADGTGKLPPVETMRLLLTALGVKDVDEVVEANTDDQGQWVDPGLTAAQAAVEAFRQGRDPADLLR